MNKTIRTSIIIAIIIVIGIILTAFYRTNFDQSYTAHKQIEISIRKEFENEEIKKLIKEVVGNKEVKVQKAGTYQDTAVIKIKEISDEELENLNTKINEKYELENTVEDIEITEIPKASTVDYIKPYIKPLIIAFVIIAVYVALYIVVIKRKK